MGGKVDDDDHAHCWRDACVPAEGHGHRLAYFRQEDERLVINNERYTNDIFHCLSTVNQISLADNYYIVFRTMYKQRSVGCIFIVTISFFFLFRVVDNAYTKVDSIRALFL